MNSVTHAVTPTDTRLPPRPASAHPANIASRKHSAQTLSLALEIADTEVDGIVEMYTPALMKDGQIWCDTSKVPEDMRHHQEDIELASGTAARALRYIGLRNPDAFPWRFVRHPEQPELVRFEAKS